VRLAVVFVALVLIASCSAATLREPEPELPRIRCIPVGALPDDSGWWVYVCTFKGDTVPPLPTLDGPIAGV